MSAADHTLPVAKIRSEARRRGLRLAFGDSPRPWMLERRAGDRAPLRFPDRQALTDYLLQLPVKPMTRL